MPHCLGAIKHVAINQPSRSGMIYFNYKKLFSIILLAVTDANYHFIFCDIGCEGSAGDAHMFNHSNLKAYIEVDVMHWPRPDLMTNDQAMPYILVRDNAFVSRPGS